MQASSSEREAVKRLAQRAKPLHVIVAYEEIKTGRNAMRTYAQLIREVGAGLQFQSTLASFQLLADPAFAEQSSLAAAAADILIISASGSAPPPAAVRGWVEGWLAARRGGEGVLIGMTEALAGRPVPESLFHQYLADVAEEAGIPYLRETFSSSPEPDFAFERIHARAQAVIPLMSDTVDAHGENSRWGINE